MHVAVWGAVPPIELRETMADSHACPDAVAADAAKNPLPPYKDGDNPADGLSCYITGCMYKGHAWGSLLHHLRLRHSITSADLEGTYLLKVGKEEINTYRKQARTVSKDHPTQHRIHKEHIRQDLPSQCSSTWEGRSSSSLEGQYIWKPLLCWVRCTPDGTPVHPLDIGGMVAGAADPQFFEPEGVEADGYAGTAATAQVKGGQGTWTSQLPEVSIKQAYKDTMVPDPSAAGGRSQKWPIPLGGFKVDIPGFNHYLTSEKLQCGATKEDVSRGLTRVFHMLEVEGHDLSVAKDASDPAVLVAIYIFEVHKDLFNLPLLAPVFSWTGRVLVALTTFCAWQKGQVTKQHLISDDVHWLKYATAIDQLSFALRGGPQKRFSSDKHKRVIGRRIGDAVKLETFPPVPMMKEAVSKAMCALNYIHSAHHCAGQLSKTVQSAATAALVGIVWLNGFGGRKKEWELMLRDHCQEQFSLGLDFLVCHTHKTSSTYGSLAKWVAPGTAQAIKTYMSLPCREGIKTLFVPLDEEADHISIPKAFQKFCKAYLPATCTHPTVNLMRKWYHTELYKMATSDDRLLQLMQSIDAHSTRVARKHYVLQTPADDAKLAQALVHSMLGKPVPWPSEAELQDVDSTPASYLQLVEVVSKPQNAEVDEEDVPENEWAWWEGAETFGLPKPLLALQIDTVMEEVEVGAMKKEPRKAKGDNQQGPQCSGAEREEAKEECLTEMEPPVKRGRQSPFTTAQKDWIQAKAKAWCPGIPPMIEVRALLAEGQKIGKLPQHATAEQVRHVCRKAQ